MSDTVVIFQYDSLQSYLSAVFEEKKENNPRLSLRSWSKQLGFSSPNVISMVIRGERNLNSNSISRLKFELGLSANEEVYLDMLCSKSKAKTDIEESAYQKILNGLKPDNEFNKIDFDKFQIISEWYHVALLEIMNLKDFRYDLDWIYQRLGCKVDKQTISDTYDRLLKVGLVKVSGDTLVAVEEAVSTLDDVPSDAIKSFHKQMFYNAMDALDTQSVDERDFGGMTMAISKESYGKYKELIRNFQKDLYFLQKNDSNTKDEVYHISTQIFRVSQ